MRKKGKRAREAASKELKMIVSLQNSPCHPWQGHPMRSQEILSPNNTAAATSAGRRRPPRGSLHSLRSFRSPTLQAPANLRFAQVRSYRRLQRIVLGTLGEINFANSNRRRARASGRRAPIIDFEEYKSDSISEN